MLYIKILLNKIQYLHHLFNSEWNYAYLSKSFLKIAENCVFISLCSKFVYIQGSSYYKMRSRIFEPRMGPGQTTGCRDPIFCLISHMGIPTGAIEAIFKFRPLSWDMGVPWGDPGGSPGVKNYFWIFGFFLVEYDYLRSFSLLLNIPTLFLLFFLDLFRLKNFRCKIVKFIFYMFIILAPF